MEKHDCSYDELVECHKLVPHPDNPNKHPETQIERLAKIIDYQGQRSPIIVCKETGFIVVGHGRLEAIKKLGWDKVAVNYQTFKDDAQRYAHMTADNAIAEWAALDLTQINQDMLDLGPELDLELLGIEDFVLEPIEKLDPGLVDEDDVPEVSEPITKLGDVWLLGDHRVMCGDSTMIDDVEKLMAGEKADMVFTDPPYNVAVVGGCKNPLDPNYQSGKTIQNDKMSDADFYQFLCDCYKGIHIASKDGAVAYIAHADSYGHIFRQAFIDSGWQLKQCIIWNKHAFVFSRQDYHWQHEPILYGWKQNQTHKFYGSRDQSTVWNFNRPSPSEKQHPTMKPVELMEKGINNSSKSGDLLYEPFTGSGSTLIACEKTNRKCFGMELDEHYCDVIVNRWQNYTGKKAKLESNGKAYDELKESNV